MMHESVWTNMIIRLHFLTTTVNKTSLIETLTIENTFKAIQLSMIRLNKNMKIAKSWEIYSYNYLSTKVIMICLAFKPMA